MRTTILLPIVVSVFLSLCTPLHAAPEVKATPSRPSTQKGTNFEITVEIEAREAISSIAIAPLIPSGFTLHPLHSPGIEVEKEKDVVRIAHLNAGSSIAIVFRGSAPRILGRSSVSTAEPKTFAFNVFYEQDGQAIPETNSRVVTTAIQYTTHISLFLVAGLVGTLLGHLIKTGVKKREDLSKTRESSGTRAALKELLGTNIAGLITLLTVGFGALLILSKDGVPAASWNQSMVLGIGLAVLTDDQLLSKLTPGKPGA